MVRILLDNDRVTVVMMDGLIPKEEVEAARKPDLLISSFVDNMCDQLKIDFPGCTIVARHPSWIKVFTEKPKYIPMDGFGEVVWCAVQAIVWKC